MGFHRLTFRLVENQISKIEFQDAVQPGRKIMKKLVEVPVRSDRLRNFEQSLVLAMQEIRSLPLCCLIVHTLKNIHRLKPIQDARSLLIFPVI